jgi:NDP-sugar pyrophosphorylase family protein
MEKMCSVDSDFAILGMPLEDAGRFSPMQVDEKGLLLGLTTVPTDPSPIVDGVSEQKAYSLINTGIYTVHQQYFSWAPVQIPGGSEFGLPHTIAAHCHEVPVQVVPGSFWYPIGFPEDLEGAAVALAEHRADHVRNESDDSVTR